MSVTLIRKKERLLKMLSREQYAHVSSDLARQLAVIEEQLGTMSAETHSSKTDLKKGDFLSQKSGENLPEKQTDKTTETEHAEQIEHSVLSPTREANSDRPTDNRHEHRNGEHIPYEPNVSFTPYMSAKQFEYDLAEIEQFFQGREIEQREYNLSPCEKIVCARRFVEHSLMCARAKDYIGNEAYLRLVRFKDLLTQTSEAIRP